MYKPNKPAQSDLMAQSRVDISANFSHIADLFEVDHMGFDSEHAGKHKKLTLQETSSPSTAAGELALFKKTGESGIASLFLRDESDGDEGGIFGSGLSGEGWARLAGGLLIKWYEWPTTLSGVTTWTYPVGAGIPVFNEVLFALAGGGNTDRYSSLTTTSVSIYPYTAVAGSPVVKSNVIVFGY